MVVMVGASLPGGAGCLPAPPGFRERLPAFRAVRHDPAGPWSRPVSHAPWVQPSYGVDAMDRDRPAALGPRLGGRPPAGVHLDRVDDPLDRRPVVVHVADPHGGARLD